MTMIAREFGLAIPATALLLLYPLAVFAQPALEALVARFDRETVHQILQQFCVSRVERADQQRLSLRKEADFDRLRGIAPPGACSHKRVSHDASHRRQYASGRCRPACSHS